LTPTSFFAIAAKNRSKKGLDKTIPTALCQKAGISNKVIAAPEKAIIINPQILLAVLLNPDTLPLSGPLQEIQSLLTFTATPSSRFVMATPRCFE
jgi:hypothetical protein